MQENSVQYYWDPDYVDYMEFLMTWEVINVGSPNQDSIYFYAIFHRENLKQDSFNSFPPKVSRYLSTLII